MEELQIWVRDIPEAGPETKAFFAHDADTVLAKIPVETLRSSVTSVCTGLGQVFKDLKDVGGFGLQEVSIQLEVTITGGINLVGTATAEGKGAITLKFAK